MKKISLSFAGGVRTLVAGMLALGLAALLTACPGVVSLGHFGVDVIATNSERCDDGMKVVVEGIGEDWEWGETLFNNLGDNIRERGQNWVWAEPGKIAMIFWDVPVGTPASENPEGKQLTIKAYCMRKNADPGLSERAFKLSDYIAVRGGNKVLEMDLQVIDRGKDPDYTVTAPGLTIEEEE